MCNQILLIIVYNVETLNIFDPELQLINTKPMIKSKLKKLLNEFKKFKVQTVLVLDYKKKRNDCKIKHLSAKLSPSVLLFFLPSFCLSFSLCGHFLWIVSLVFSKFWHGARKPYEMCMASLFMGP